MGFNSAFEGLNNLNVDNVTIFVDQGERMYS